MQFAIDENLNRVHIDDAIGDRQYTCPFCQSPMIQRRGSINIPHFAHAKGYSCTDTWHYEEMSKWHMEWQKRYPISCREAVVEKDNVRHRADVLVHGTVIEFQHSPISLESFQERNRFYISAGFRVIWLFDFRDKYQDRITEDGRNKNLFHWTNPSKLLSGFDLFGDTQIYYQLSDSKGGWIIRLIDYSMDDYSWFRTNWKTQYSIEQFVGITTEGFIIKDDDCQKLFHKLYLIRTIDGELEYFGCPINKGGYAPLIREYHRTACDECEWCIDSDDNTFVACNGRYREHMQRIRVILEHNQLDGYKNLKYLDENGRIFSATISDPESPEATIIELSQKYNARVMIVRNVQTGRCFKITGNPEVMSNRYNHVYGYRRLDGGLYTKKSDKIFYWWKPIWIMVWFAQ